MVLYRSQNLKSVQLLWLFQDLGDVSTPLIHSTVKLIIYQWNWTMTQNMAHDCSQRTFTGPFDHRSNKPISPSQLDESKSASRAHFEKQIRIWPQKLSFIFQIQSVIKKKPKKSEMILRSKSLIIFLLSFFIGGLFVLCMGDKGILKITVKVGCSFQNMTTIGTEYLHLLIHKQSLL